MATLVFVALALFGLVLAAVGLLSLRHPAGRLLRLVVLLMTLAVLFFLLQLAWRFVTSG